MPRRYDDDDDGDDDDFDIGRRKKKRGGSKSEAVEKLTGPAIGLMVVVGLHIVMLCIALPLNIANLAGHGVMAAQGHNNMAFAGNPAVSIVQCLIGFLVQGFILFGAIQMKKGSMYGVSMASAILSVIPCCCSSCGILGIPFGIWALILLMDPEVKSAFDS